MAAAPRAGGGLSWTAGKLAPSTNRQSCCCASRRRAAPRPSAATCSWERGRVLTFGIDGDTHASFLGYSYNAEDGAGEFNFHADNATLVAHSARLDTLKLAQFIHDPDGNRVVRFLAGSVVPGDDVSLGTSINPFANLHVQNLVASNVVRVDSVATIDGSVVAAPNGKLTRALISGSTQVYLDDATRRDGEHMYLKTIVNGVPQYEEVTLDSSATSIGGGEYRYDLLRDVSHFTGEPPDNGGYNWPKGAVVVSRLLNPGEGWFEITAGQGHLRQRRASL